MFHVLTLPPSHRHKYWTAASPGHSRWVPVLPMHIPARHLKTSKQQPKANTHHGNWGQSPPCRDWDCFKKSFTSNLCKILAQLRQALSQQAPDSSLSHLSSLLEGNCSQQRLSPSRKQAQTQGRQRSTPTSAPLQPHSCPFPSVPASWGCPAPAGVCMGVSASQNVLTSFGSSSWAWPPIILGSPLAQHLQIPACGMDIRPPPHQLCHIRGTWPGWPWTGHHAGLGLLSRKSCKQGLGGIMRFWGMSSGEFLRIQTFSIIELWFYYPSMLHKPMEGTTWPTQAHPQGLGCSWGSHCIGHTIIW